MHARLFRGGEDSGRFHNVVSASDAPFDVTGVHLVINLDGLSVGGDGFGILVVGNGDGWACWPRRASRGCGIYYIFSKHAVVLLAFDAELHPLLMHAGLFGGGTPVDSTT